MKLALKRAIDSWKLLACTCPYCKKFDRHKIYQEHLTSKRLQCTNCQKFFLKEESNGQLSEKRSKGKKTEKAR